MGSLSNMMWNLFVIQAAIGGVYHKAALKLKLTDSEIDIFSLLAMEGDGCNQTELYQKTATSKSTTTMSVMMRILMLCISRIISVCKV